jgi:PA14 domain/Putative Ig domain
MDNIPAEPRRAGGRFRRALHPRTPLWSLLRTAWRVPALCLSAAPSLAQNLVTNGGFAANAAQFTTWPGYVGFGANPTTIPGWTQVAGPSGGYGINGAASGVTAFSPLNAAGQTHLFIQNGGKTVAQTLPTLAPNTAYILSFLAAARHQAGETNDLFAVRIADSRVVIATSGALAAVDTSFQAYSIAFHTPAGFSGTPSIQLQNLSGTGDHTVDFTSVVVLPAATSGLTVFLPSAGNWNSPANWSTGLPPLSGQSPDILNGTVVTVDAAAGACDTLYVGQGDQRPTATVLFRPGASLAAQNLVLGRDGANFGLFNQSGGTLTVDGSVSVGDGAGGGTGATGELLVTGGLLQTSKPGATVLIGNQGLGRMLLAGNAVVSTANLTIGATPGGSSSQMFQWGGTLAAGNVTIGGPGATNCALTTSGGATLWTGTMRVNGRLVLQGSQTVVQQAQPAGGLHLGPASTLEFDLDTSGIEPLLLPSSPFGVEAGARLVVDGSKYVRFNGAPGTFTLVKYAGGSEAVRLAPNVMLTGFGNLTASLNYQSNALSLVLAAPTNGAPAFGNGLLCEYWEVPITVNPGAGRSIPAPLTTLPDFSDSLVVTHPVFGRTVGNIDLSPRLRDTDYFMRFTGFLYAPTNGGYTFYLKSDDGSKLWLDNAPLINNDGAHAATELAAATSLAAGFHALRVEYFQAGGGQTLGVGWSGPGFGKQPIPDAALFLTAATNKPHRQPVFQDIVQDAEAAYNYAPSFMYDEVEGLYKIWMCGNGVPGAVGGDNILLREAPTLEGLMTAPLTVALQPSLDPTKFDQVDACDPSVYRVGNLLYMAYGGNTDNSGLPATTRAGMAVSYDGGRNFQRLNGGVHILAPTSSAIDPNAYGVGQPAVARAADGFYYMIYTDAEGHGSPDFERVIRSADPAFRPGSFTNVASIPASNIGGYSLDLSYDAVRNEFIVVNGLTMIFYNTQWTELRRVTRTNPYSWKLGEGHGLLTDSQRHPVAYNQDGETSYVLAASTVDAAADTSLWAPWVAGDLKYLVLPRAVPAPGAIVNRTLTAGQSATVPIGVTDPEEPLSALRFSLIDPPAGATINATNGIFTWRPAIDQSPSTHLITVEVQVDGAPALASTQTFTVTVNRPRSPVLTPLSATTGLFSFTVDGDAGPDYTLLTSTNLIDWTVLQSLQPLQFPFTVRDPLSSNRAPRFYSVQLGP